MRIPPPPSSPWTGGTRSSCRSLAFCARPSQRGASRRLPPSPARARRSAGVPLCRPDAARSLARDLRLSSLLLRVDTARLQSACEELLGGAEGARFALWLLFGPEGILVRARRESAFFRERIGCIEDPVPERIRELVRGTGALIEDLRRDVRDFRRLLRRCGRGVGHRSSCTRTAGARSRAPWVSSATRRRWPRAWRRSVWSTSGCRPSRAATARSTTPPFTRTTTGACAMRSASRCRSSATAS